MEDCTLRLQGPQCIVTWELQTTLRIKSPGFILIQVHLSKSDNVMLSKLLPGPQLFPDEIDSRAFSKPRNPELHSYRMVKFTSTQNNRSCLLFFISNHKQDWNKLGEREHCGMALRSQRLSLAVVVPSLLWFSTSEVIKHYAHVGLES